MSFLLYNLRKIIYACSARLLASSTSCSRATPNFKPSILSRLWARIHKEMGCDLNGASASPSGPSASALIVAFVDSIWLLLWPWQSFWWWQRWQRERQGAPSWGPAGPHTDYRRRRRRGVPAPGPRHPRIMRRLNGFEARALPKLVRMHHS